MADPASKATMTLHTRLRYREYDADYDYAYCAILDSPPAGSGGVAPAATAKMQRGGNIGKGSVERMGGGNEGDYVRLFGLPLQHQRVGHSTMITIIRLRLLS